MTHYLEPPETDHDAWRRLQTKAAAGGDGALPLLHDLHPHLRYKVVYHLSLNRPFSVCLLSSYSIQKAWGLTVFSPQAWRQDPGGAEDPLSWHRGPLVRPHAGQAGHSEAQPGQHNAAHGQDKTRKNIFDIKEDEFSFECRLLLQEMIMVVGFSKNNCPLKI